MHDPLVGQQLGGYLVHELLGRGGMARVYRATEQALEREVALKVLQDGTTQTLGGAERFLREARTLARLQHPAIVQIYNVGQIQGMSYLVQELLPGPALDDELKQLHAQGRQMEPAEVQHIIARLADALDYAHQRGIIHRDLKPANVLRNQRGEVVLVDFGIAKAADEGQKLTQTGLVLGTPAYLAPEQCTGDPDLTHAVDIYALGIILYELLAGRVPFDDPSALAVAMAHVNTPPPPICDTRPDISPAVEAVVLRALAKAPADRYPSAGALAADLERAWNAPDAIHAAPTTINPALPARRAAAPMRESAPGLPAAPAQGSAAAPRWRMGLLALVPLLGWLILRMFGGDASGVEAEHSRDAQATPPGVTAPAGVPMPQLVGRSLDEAQSLALELGLTIQVVEQQPSDLAAGQILSQQPDVDTLLPVGSTVDVVVSSGPAAAPAPQNPVSPPTNTEDNGKGNGKDNGKGGGKGNGKGNGKGKDD